MNNDFVKASSTLIGTMIGAGIFGIPFVFAQAGFLIGTIFFVILASVMFLLNLMYAETIERTHGKHRLIGYVNIYFGEKFKKLISFSVIIGVYGTLLAYILLANIFSNALFGNIASHNFLWGFLFWIFLSLGVVKGIKTIARAEVIMLVLLIITLLVIILRGFPMIDFSNFTTINLSNLFLPYGVILFALGGLSAVPEMRALIRKNDKTFRNSVIAGFSVSVFIMYIFTVVILGVSGGGTSQDAISGLLPYLGSFMVYVGAIFGLLAISTSYLVIGTNLKESYMYDWKMKKTWSNLLIVAVPISLALFGLRNFITVIGATGAMLGALNGSIIVWMFVRAKKQGQRKPSFELKIPMFISIFVVIALIAGGAYVILNLLAR